MNYALIISYFLLGSNIDDVETIEQFGVVEHTCGHGYKHGNVIAICGKKLRHRDLDGNNVFLREDVADAFLRMKKQALADGIILRINYAFRTKHQQKSVKKRNKGLAAKIGYSPHQQGIAIDIAGTVQYKKRKRIKTEIGKWLEQKSHLFGFIKTIPHEEWHYEFKVEKRI